MSKLSDVGAERAVLAGIFQYGNDGYIEVSDIIDSKTFTIESNKFIYQCIEHAIKHNPQLDIPVFLSAANDLGLSEFFREKVEIEYLRSLTNFPIELANIRGQAKKIKKLEIGRQVQYKLKIAHNKIDNITGNETVDEILAFAEEPIFGLIQEFNSGEDQPQLIGKDIKDYVEYLKTNPNRKIGISTGYPKYDFAIGGGLRRRKMALIGARPKTGKSTLADNIAVHVSKVEKIPVLMLDTEMVGEDHHNRLLAYFSRIDVNDITGARFVGKKYLEEKVDRAANIIESLPYTYKNVSGKDFSEILSIIRRWVYQTVGFDKNGRTNDCLVIYDYFKLMNSSDLKSMQEFQALGFQVSEMHNFCVEYDVPVLGFVQLNRDGIEGELTSSVSQSDRLVWLCGNIAFFKKKSSEEIAEDGELNGNRKMIIVETRDGPGMDEGNYINMGMQGQFASIIELRTKAEVRYQGSNSGFEVNDDESTENQSS